MLVTKKCPKLNLSNQKRGRLKKESIIYLIWIWSTAYMRNTLNPAVEPVLFILAYGQPWSQLHACICPLICSTDSVIDFVHAHTECVRCSKCPIWTAWGLGEEEVCVCVCVRVDFKTEFCFGVKCEVTFSTNTPSSTAVTRSCSSASSPPIMKMVQSQV